MDRGVQGVDEHWMRLALNLAKAAQGQTSPNPLVGAVVVKDGRLLGSGAHLKAGTPHAEVHALNMASEETVGSTLYVTLEPCNHTGRTPPCTERVIAAGIHKVVIGSLDPDRRVSGEGVKRLQEAGIEVVTGVLQADCLRINEAYFHHRRTGYPFVTLKAAITLDGKMATATGDSRWVTGEEARQEVQRLRHIHDAVMVGVGTVIKDHPRLTARLPEGGNHPIRVILDSRLSMPLNTPVTDTAATPTWVFCCDEVDTAKKVLLQERGVSVIRTGPGPRVNLERVFQHLGDNGILSVLTEAGGELNASLLQEGWVKRVMFFIAPKLLGGKESPTAVEGEGWERMEQAWELDELEMRPFGQDWCITGLLRQTRWEG
ncbi:bifunctional diaminohydroxyphosphoribosylaminopyrimidine deaminase/5-amino-6-(5-phosphoribosylamino)uracil reductase RibD [Desmospora activa]|uniref:Riboflavin biosynthesis protein RibD n=1 Tax=Desmospora activa DSM 45169 TaxID=1121389 RepID=A0A2T4Z9Q7_9BACL|nr:bifunctional diaminohydroxyphosphoribosylaminopyrimidine deaminase/5-amino-6-(5-phosphoribosylamino)uracil reductase RibD [Desmospora activa]PTM58626.1 diaminohydroxyphosphoribosylaminopyrimidine deaminase [Desmospora activa DSM 45169]